MKIIFLIFTKNLCFSGLMTREHWKDIWLEKEQQYGGNQVYIPMILTVQQ